MSAFHVIKDEIKICGLNLRNPIAGAGQQSIHFDGFPRNDKSEGLRRYCSFYLFR